MRRRRTAIVLFLAFAVAVIFAALAGIHTAPGEELFDPRRSTFLTGPEGSSGFAAALEQFGVQVERRRRALFAIAADSATIDTTAWLALLDVRHPPSRAEAQELVSYVKRGGTLFLATAGRRRIDGLPMLGPPGVENCFDFRVARVPSSSRVDALAVELPDGAAMLAGPRFVLRRGRTDEDESRDDLFKRDACEAGQPKQVDELLRTRGREIVASRLTYENGGHVILLADSRYLSNRDLKETDAGLVVLPWILEESPSRLVVDEYHQGFGNRGSILMAAWGWVRTTPGGWAVLQLTFAALVALAVAAIRFGPAVSVVQRRRRSPIEHLDALAVGLERAEGRDIAVELIASGLRRRLSRSGHRLRSTRGNMAQWLAALGLATRTDEAHKAVKRLGSLLRVRGGDERVLNAAIAVEDVWKALRPTHRREQS